MSALGDLWTELKNKLSSPEDRAAIEGLEKSVLETVKLVGESAIPPFLRPFVGGLVDSLAEKGITEVVHVTDEALAKLGTVTLLLGSSKMALSAAPAVPPSPTQFRLTGDQEKALVNAVADGTLNAKLGLVP